MPQKTTASDLPFHYNFAALNVPPLKNFKDVIARDLWFGPPRQSKIPVRPMLSFQFVRLLIIGVLQSVGFRIMS